jgi:putative nucleotidyltransferase with HDIG domain
MKKRILFVDDEPRILEGLRQGLRRQRSSWEMSFVESGEEALKVLGTEPIDVVISDLRMPGMDGANLLKRVQAEYPEVVRIVLSGHAELEMALRAVPVAHQFLNKPCEPGRLVNVVSRACSLQALLSDDSVRSIVGKIDSLPSLPRVYSELVKVLADEDTSCRDVARILKQDMSMCAKLLQVVNSAFFRLSRTVTKIEEAVTYLGFGTIKQLALGIEVFRLGNGNPSLGGLSLEELQKHSMLVACIASGLFDDSKEKEDAFVAGMLHDIGKLLLAVELPDHVEKVVATMRAEGGAWHTAEESCYGVTHADIGAYLLGLWGLPCPIVEAVAYHHAPGHVEQEGFDILAAVYLANALAAEQMPPQISGIKSEITAIEPAYLDGLGVGDKLDEWREMAKKMADDGSSGPSAPARS